MQIRNHAQLRDSNVGTIFHTIHAEGPISRIDVATRLGLAQSTVSVITGELQEKNLIRECGHAASTGGRRPVLLEVNPQGGHFVSVDLRGSELFAGVVDLSLNLVHQVFYPTVSSTGEDLYDKLVRVVRTLQDWCRQEELPLLGIGVATPGMIDSNGSVIEADNLKWYDFPLKERLEANLGVFVVVENDSNAAAFGEYQYGLEHQLVQNMIFVSIDTGIGAGIVLDGQLYTGSSGLAGEIGHVSVRRNGPLCACGKKGCIEAIASGPAMIRAYNTKKMTIAEPSVDLDDFFRHVDEQNSLARQIAWEAAEDVGMVIANQVNMLNLDTVILGGAVVAASEAMFRVIEHATMEMVLPKFQSGLKLRSSSLGSKGGLIGIAWIGLNQVFLATVDKNPLIQTF